MQLEHFRIAGGKRKTLIVLGAGASRGASFVLSKVKVLPPLDADFFQQLSRLYKSESAERLLEFVRSEYGHEARLSMEQFFSEIDYTKRFHDELNVDRGPRVKRYSQALDHFYIALADLLNESTKLDCVYHRRLAGLLHADDSVISFNYDCIMDRALRDAGGHRWDPDSEGYGFEIASGGDSWKKNGKGRKPTRSIQLLKMHGSSNWRIEDKAIHLDDPSTINTLKNRIIPPTWFKNLTELPYSAVWKNARIAVRAARIIVVIGYSVPQTDLFSRSLFKAEAGSKDKREKLDLLVTVNPDRDSRRKFVDIVSGGFEPGTRVLEFDTFYDLAELLV